jgi:lipid A ethanolaminephosphotransferase
MTVSSDAAERAHPAAAGTGVSVPLAIHWPDALRKADAWLARPRSARTVVAALSVYLLLAANWPLWLELARIGGAPSVYLRSIGVMAVLAGVGTVAVLSLTAWTRGMKPVWFAVVLLSAVAQHYMLTYHVVMDPTMAANAMQTDAHEARDLLSWRLLFNVILVCALPAWGLLRVRILPMRPIAQLWRNAALCAVALAVAAASAVATSREFAPLMRNHVTLRYMMNPLASLYSASAVVLKPLFQHSRKLIPIAGGAALGTSYAAQAKPPLFVVVVGETARSDHFALNGYARNTTPELAARQVVSWPNVHSCGTNTLASVPCMFSPLGKTGYEGRKDDYENLVDLAQAVGLAVLWIDNQAGCKGVCVRVPTVSASEGLDAATRSALCDGDECLDDVMLKNIDQRIAALPAERRDRGVLLVLHQMGSHGPSYAKRSAPDTKRFMPECTTNVLADCSHGELMNAYDNSIVHTDRFLARTIDWLKAQSPHYDTGMLYMSDHGESLGEYGLFLHGLPYNIAPDVQKHVPMVAWFGDGLKAREHLSTACLEKGRDAALTHDNLFHTVIGVMDLKTPTYKPALDAFAACRGPAA